MGSAGAAIGGSILSGGAQIMGAKSDAKAMRSQAAFNRAQAEANARRAEADAELVLKKGSDLASQNLKDVGQTIGAQRVALAAQGIVVDEGTAMTVQEQAKEIGLKDALTIRNNARREAMGFKREALDLRVSSLYAQAGAERAAADSLLAGTIGAIGSIASSAGSSGLKNNPSAGKASK